MRTYFITIILLLDVYYSNAQVQLDSSYHSSKHQIVCSAFSGDSKYIASGCFDKKILIWNEKGEVLKELSGLKDFPLSLVFSKDGNFLISGGKDSKVTIWSLQSNSILFTMKGHTGDVTSVDISRDNIIVSGSKDNTIRLWSINGELLSELKGHSKEVTSVKFSDDGQKLVSGCADGNIKEWDAKSKTEIRTIKAHEGWTRSVAYNYNGTLIASGGDDGKIQIWNSANGQLQNSIIAHSKWIQTIAFSPDGKYVLSGGHDNYLVLIDANTGTITFNSPKQDNYVLSVAFNPNGKNFISTTLFSEKIDIWDSKSLNITNLSAEPISPKTKASITWITANELTTDNLTFKLKASIFSESKISSIDLFLNNKQFSSDRDLNNKNSDNKIEYDKVVFLDSGLNRLKIVAYNDGGEANSEEIKVNYSAPIEVKSIPLVSLPEKRQEVVKEEIKTVSDNVSTKNLTGSTNLSNEDLLSNLAVNKPNPYRFALIIGNEDYSTYQTGLQSESNVAYAINDAKAFNEYALKIFGVPSDNIILLTNARAIEMDNAINKLPSIIKALNGKAEIIFFYAGHGFPDEQTKEPYLIPVDVSGTNLKYALKIKDLYFALSEFPSKKITLFLDACFSGGAREQGLLSARGVKVKPKDNLLTGNVVVYTASSGNESALSYKEKQHGLFTYLLLAKLKESGGDISYKELSDYLTEQVGVKSVMINNKPQTPQTNIGFDIVNTWQDWNIFK
jgi:WD40 repeat protein